MSEVYIFVWTAWLFISIVLIFQYIGIQEVPEPIWLFYVKLLTLVNFAITILVNPITILYKYT